LRKKTRNQAYVFNEKDCNKMACNTIPEVDRSESGMRGGTLGVREEMCVAAAKRKEDEQKKQTFFIHCVGSGDILCHIMSYYVMITSTPKKHVLIVSS
jgi:hypothetical protein